MIKEELLEPRLYHQVKDISDNQNTIQNNKISSQHKKFHVYHDRDVDTLKKLLFNLEDKFQTERLKLNSKVNSKINRTLKKISQMNSKIAQRHPRPLILMPSHSKAHYETKGKNIVFKSVYQYSTRLLENISWGGRGITLQELPKSLPVILFLSSNGKYTAFCDQSIKFSFQLIDFISHSWNSIIQSPFSNFFIITNYSSSNFYLLNTETGNLLSSINYSLKPISRLIWFSQFEILLGLVDGSIVLGSIEDNYEFTIICKRNLYEKSITAMYLIDSIKKIVCGDVDGNVYAFKFNDESMLNKSNLHKGEVASVCYFSKKKIIISGGLEDKMLFLVGKYGSNEHFMTLDNSIICILPIPEQNYVLIQTSKEIIALDAIQKTIVNRLERKTSYDNSSFTGMCINQSMQQIIYTSEKGNVFQTKYKVY